MKRPRFHAMDNGRWGILRTPDSRRVKLDLRKQAKNLLALEDFHPDVDRDGMVDTADLSMVVAGWGEVYGVNHLLAVISAWTMVPPPATTNVTFGEYGGYEIPDGGPWFITGADVDHVARGINANNGPVTELNVTDGTFDSAEYGTWFDWITVCRYRNAHFHVGGGTNPYGLRGVGDEFWAYESSWHNNGGKAVFRLTGIDRGEFVGCTFEGGPVWLGGGAGDGNLDEHLGFDNVTFRSCVFSCTKPMSGVELYSKCDNITFENCNFHGSLRAVNIWAGATNIRFVNCFWNGQPLRYEHLRFAAGASVSVAASPIT